jgi:hypothetical protein
LARIFELIEIGKLGDDNLRRDRSETWDGFDEFAFGLKLGIFFDELGNRGAEGGDFFLRGFDLAFQAGDDAFFCLRFEHGFTTRGILGERIGVTAQCGNPLLVAGFWLPWAQFEMFGLDEAGNEFCIGGVAFVAA